MAEDFGQSISRSRWFSRCWSCCRSRITRCGATRSIPGAWCWRARSLSDLFANLRYTGHPGLWYLLVWAASWFTDSPYAVQVVHAGISVLLIAAIGLWSPFSRLEKVLLLCSYFVLFEYTVISRNYGIGMLLAFVYAQCRATQPERALPQRLPSRPAGEHQHVRPRAVRRLRLRACARHADPAGMERSGRRSARCCAARRSTCRSWRSPSRRWCRLPTSAGAPPASRSRRTST